MDFPFFALIIGYLILGKDVLITAAKNIGKGHVFDENFLMGVATIAAIVIGDYQRSSGCNALLSCRGVI